MILMNPRCPNHNSIMKPLPELEVMFKDHYVCGLGICYIHKDSELMTKVKKSLQIEDGKYTGTIARVEERTEPYEYADIFVKLDNPDVELKCGVPNNIAVDRKGVGTTKLAKILTSLGVEMKPDEEIDLNQVLSGKKISFLVANEESEHGTFVHIVEKSIKPA